MSRIKRQHFFCGIARIFRPSKLRIDHDQGIPGIKVIRLPLIAVILPTNAFSSEDIPPLGGVTEETPDVVTSEAAVNTVSELTLQAQATVGTGSAPCLGEALREVKRQALLDSLPMALCVVAFGDADWRL